MEKITLKFYLNAHDNYCLYADESLPATVPGGAQLDYARHIGLPNYKYSDNYKQYEFLEDKYFLYSARLPSQKPSGKRLFVYFGGIDYRYDIFLEDEKLYSYEGMFKPCEIELTSYDYAGKLLKVLIYPVPKKQGAKKGRWEADNVAKPPVSYGWDWHPRLIPSGIWKESFLIEREDCYIAAFEPHYTLSEDLSAAFLDLGLKASCKDCLYEIKVTAPDGKMLDFAFNEGESGIIEIKNPMLWWPHEYGGQNLYTISVKLFCGGDLKDSAQKTTGFRRARLIPQKSNWAIDKFPFTQAYPPITLEINGKQIFGKGSNWVNPEIYFGTITEKLYCDLLTLAKDSNMNLLRVWGGSIVNKEEFFDICDRLGIMVWQEFPLACNCYKDDPRYLSVMESESEAIIKSCRVHPSLVMWVGGNELFTEGSSMTEQFKVLRLLNSQCFIYDKDTPFLYTSPIMGMRHGHYRFIYPNEIECFKGFQNTLATAFTEFGSPGASDYDYLKNFIPPDELTPEATGKSWEAHHGINAWEKDSWLYKNITERYFGKGKSLKDTIDRSRILQRVGYKAMFEEARRQKPSCSMALNWCYNEPWPTAANNSLVNYPAVPKDALKYVKKSLQPVVLSARADKFAYYEGEKFRAELFLLNDLYKSFNGIETEVYLKFNGSKTLLLRYCFNDVKENENALGPVVQTVMPHYKKSGLFKLVLQCINYPQMSNEYEFMYYNSETVEKLHSKEAPPMDFVGLAEVTENFNQIELE